MDESGKHHSQQTDTRTENQTLHVLTHRWVLNNEDTGTGASYTGVFWGGTAGGGEVGGDNMGRNARYR